MHRDCGPATPAAIAHILPCPHFLPMLLTRQGSPTRYVLLPAGDECEATPRIRPRKSSGQAVALPRWTSVAHLPQHKLPQQARFPVRKGPSQRLIDSDLFGNAQQGEYCRHAGQELYLARASTGANLPAPAPEIGPATTICSNDRDRLVRAVRDTTSPARRGPADWI